MFAYWTLAGGDAEGIGDPAERVRRLRRPMSTAEEHIGNRSRRKRQPVADEPIQEGCGKSVAAGHTCQRQRADEARLDEAEPARRQGNQGEQRGRGVCEQDQRRPGVGAARPQRPKSAPERARRFDMLRVSVMGGGAASVGLRRCCAFAQRVSDPADDASSGLAQTADMLPLSDGLTARRFPIVNVSLIVANFAVWIFYELPHLGSSVFHASFYPCTVNGSWCFISPAASPR